MAEVFYKGSLYRFCKSNSNGRGSWICKEGMCIGQLTRTNYVSVPIMYWSKLQDAAEAAGYDKSHFAPAPKPVKVSTAKKSRTTKKSKNPSISIF